MTAPRLADQISGHLLNRPLLKPDFFESVTKKYSSFLYTAQMLKHVEHHLTAAGQQHVHYVDLLYPNITVCLCNQMPRLERLIETGIEASPVLPSDKTQIMTKTKKVATAGRKTIRNRLRMNSLMNSKGNCVGGRCQEDRIMNVRQNSEGYV